MTHEEKKLLRRQRKVPKILVYEVMDGKPIHYHGYKSVLNKTKKPEDIMGSSALQAVIVNFILSILHKQLNEDSFWIMTNEAGVHLNHGNNLAGDIMLFDKTRLKASDIRNKYTETPANIVIEVDTKADLSVMKFEQYMKLKTKKLHDFGVDKIL